MKADLFSAIDSSVTGLRAQRYRMNVIAENLANVQTTKTASGQPYRRKEVLFSSGNPAPDFSFVLNSTYEKYAKLTQQDRGAEPGVRVLLKTKLLIVNSTSRGTRRQTQKALLGYRMSIRWWKWSICYQPPDLTNLTLRP